MVRGFFEISSAEVFWLQGEKASNFYRDKFANNIAMPTHKKSSGDNIIFNLIQLYLIYSGKPPISITFPFRRRGREGEGTGEREGDGEENKGRGKGI